MTEHTPTPWKAFTRKDDSQLISIGDPRNGYHSQFDWLGTPSELRTVIRCVNSHDALVKALEPFAKTEEWFAGTVWENANDEMEVFYDYKNGSHVTVGDFRRARAALAAAKEE